MKVDVRVLCEQEGDVGGVARVNEAIESPRDDVERVERLPILVAGIAVRDDGGGHLMPL